MHRACWRRMEVESRWTNKIYSPYLDFLFLLTSSEELVDPRTWILSWEALRAAAHVPRTQIEFPFFLTLLKSIFISKSKVYFLMFSHFSHFYQVVSHPFFYFPIKSLHISSTGIFPFYDPASTFIIRTLISFVFVNSVLTWLNPC